MKKLIITFLFFLLLKSISAQIVYTNVAYTKIYDFLDEMATLNLIDLNSAIKPYSRIFISECLEKIASQQEKLNERQKKELSFYRLDYFIETSGLYIRDFYFKKYLFKKEEIINKRTDLYFYKDSLFTITINPIIGMEYFFNDSGTIHHRWNGLEGWAYFGKHWGMYADLRDNRINGIINGKSFLVLRPGEDNKGGEDYSEMNGGITYSWGWGSTGLIKDRFIWGDNNHGSNIFSGRTPTFTRLELKMKPVQWFEFNYFHGWLVSEVIDSNSIVLFPGGAKRRHFYKKYLASNFFTITPFKDFKLSLGNSIIYATQNIEPAYLIPLFYFKSVEHTIGASNEANAQIFLNVSSRNMKHLHLYGTFFLDEIAFGNALDPDKQSNWFGYKLGAKIWDLFTDNYSLNFEYTRTNPMVYKHYFPTATFESNQYNLGHYLRDNAQEIYIAASYKPVKNLDLCLSYTIAQKGPDYPDVKDSTGQRPKGKKFMTEMDWESRIFMFRVNYQLFHDAFIFIEYLNSNVSGKADALKNYTPDFFRGKLNTLNIGANLGF